MNWAHFAGNVLEGFLTLPFLAAAAIIMGAEAWLRRPCARPCGRPLQPHAQCLACPLRKGPRQ